MESLIKQYIIECEAVLAVDVPPDRIAGPLKAGEAMKLQGITVFAFHDGKSARISDYS